jgi:hypothetical protein
VISFRYHLVSLAAVLLALAAGVVLGAGPLADRITDVGSASEEEELASLRAQVGSLQQRISYDDAVATALAPSVIPNRLRGRSVVVVVAPGTDRAQVQQLTEAVRSAGATVTGEVDVQPAWVDPDQATVLGTLADQLAPDDVTLPTGGPYERAGAALSTALVTDQAAAGAADDQAVAMLTGFEEGGFITVQGDPAVGAQLALVVAPPATPGQSDAGTAASQALLPLVAALDSGRGAVLGGAEGSNADGGLVAALRDSGAVRRAVSSVDVADIPSGVIAVVLALAEQAAGSSGQYGLGPGAVAAIPAVGRGG